MIHSSFIKNSILLFICGLTCFCGLVGCSQHDYKQEADEQVYNIIDQKWDEQFGVKANYKISDTTPLHNDIQVKRSVPSGVLTLPHAVALATAYNREYQLAKELLYTTALDLRLSRHEFETKFWGGMGGNYFRSRGGTDQSIQGGADLGFNRLLAQGTMISGAVALAWIDILTGDMRSGLASLLNVTVAQPLLGSSDHKIVQENLTQAERDMLYQVRSFNRYRKTFVVSIICNYYQVLELAENAKNSKENHNTLNRLCGRVEKLAAVGRVPKEELERVRQDTIQALDIHILAEQKYEHAIDAFKIDLGLPTTTEFILDKNELTALNSTEMACPDFSVSQAVEIALLQRHDLVNSADAVIDARRKIVVAADRLRGNLTLVAGTDMTPEIDTDFTTFRSQKGILDIGLRMDLPLERMAEQNEYRKAMIMLNQRDREYVQASDIIALEVRRAYQDLVGATRRHKLQSEAVELAGKRLEDTCLLLKYGRASSRRVLNAQSSLFQARNEAIDALLDYARETLEFYCAAGVLQVRPDGMWQTKEIVDKNMASTNLPIAKGSFIFETEEKNLESEEFIRLWMAKAKTKHNNR